MNAVPVTYLQSPVPQMPQRSVYVSGNDVYSYAPNQPAFIQPGVHVYGNDASLLQLSRHYQPYVAPSYVPYCGLAAGRGTKDKDKEDIDLKAGCASRGILSESIDDFKVSNAFTLRQQVCLRNN